MNSTPLLFDIEDMVVSRPFQRVAPVVVEATEDDVTGVAGIALFGELLDHLGLVQAADRRGLRPIGPGGYTGGECYRPVVELQLAGGDFISDVSLLKDEATQRLRGSKRSPLSRASVAAVRSSSRMSVIVLPTCAIRRRRYRECRLRAGFWQVFSAVTLSGPWRTRQRPVC